MKSEEIFGVQYFSSQVHEDKRGQFTKFFNKNWLSIDGFELGEAFYSDSAEGVLRGLHLQVHESSGSRIITILSGEIYDVLLDLRPHSPSYLQMRTQTLNCKEISSVYVPGGVAHGFQAIDKARTLYLSNKIHEPSQDTGVDALSIGIKWPIANFIRSPRDEHLPTLEQWIESEKNG